MKDAYRQVHRWDDIVFESRNKAYGAYTLRCEYSRRVCIALVSTLVLAGLVLTYPSIAQLFNEVEVKSAEARMIRYTDLAAPPPIDKNTPPPPKLDIPPPVKTLIKFLPPKVTDQEIQQEEEMPTIEEVKQNDVGAENIGGNGDVFFDEPVQEVIEKQENEDHVFTVVEQQAEFVGGLQEMYKFISRHLKYPASARRMGVQGSVFVSFVIGKDGVISDVQVVKGISSDCDKEAVRVISLMPEWKAAKQNGKPVKSRFVLPIKFVLS